MSELINEVFALSDNLSSTRALASEEPIFSNVVNARVELAHANSLVRVRVYVLCVAVAFERTDLSGWQWNRGN